MSWENNQLNEHFKKIDEADAKEQAIEELAEKMLLKATLAINEVVNSSIYDVSMATVTSYTNHNEQFNDVFYSLAEKIINCGVSLDENY